MMTTHPEIIEITQYVAFYYIRINIELFYGIDRIFQFPEGLIFVCISFIGAIMNEEQYFNRVVDINKKYESQIAEIRKKSNNTILSDLCKKIKMKKHIPTQIKEYQGHLYRLFALDWSYDSKYIVSCSQDGRIIVWNTHTTDKKLLIQPHLSGYMSILAVTFSPTYDFVAFGGTDNAVSIYKCTDDDGQKLMVNDDKIVELQRHDGFISCIRFTNSDSELLSCGGNGNCLLWDVEKQDTKNEFINHYDDVTQIDINKDNPNLFVSSSIDGTVRIWDIRDKNKQIGMFNGHKSDVNTVKWFVDGYGFVSGGDDGCVRFFDLKAYKEMNVYFDKDNISSYSPSFITSVAISLSGSYIYAAHENGSVLMWSTLNSNKCLHKIKHSSRVSSIAISPNGYALATASWDSNLRLFA